jgi:hypothetical protein
MDSIAVQQPELGPHYTRTTSSSRITPFQQCATATCVRATCGRRLRHLASLALLVIEALLPVQLQRRLVGEVPSHFILQPTTKQERTRPGRMG